MSGPVVAVHAVNALAKAGFTNVHNIIDGFEGIRWKILKHLSWDANAEWLEERRSMDLPS